MGFGFPMVTQPERKISDKMISDILFIMASKI